jgi:hypothetical protein
MIESRLMKRVFNLTSSPPVIAARLVLLSQMKSNSLDSSEHQPVDSEFAVYDCEIRLKFRMIEEKHVLRDREHLLEMLLDAFSYGSDEYLETVQTQVEAQEVSEIQASPEMRRQLIRLRNSSDLA